jgi:hypothetical protein
MDQKIYLKWEDNVIIWDDTLSYGAYHFTWDQVWIVQQAQQAVGGGGWSPRQQFERIREKLPEEEVKKFIKVVCEVNGRIYSEKKYKQVEAQLTVDDIKKTFDTVLRVKVENS